MRGPQKDKVRVPMSPALKNMIGRVLSERNPILKKDAPSASEVRNVTRKIFREVGRYVDDNIQTDPVHQLEMLGCLAAAERALKDPDPWIGYAVAITRLVLVLLGDYPDNRKRTTGRRGDHYLLNRHRSITYTRSDEQRYRQLFVAYRNKLIKNNPLLVSLEYAKAVGRRPRPRDLLAWYREKYAEDYLALV